MIKKAVFLCLEWPMERKTVKKVEKISNILCVENEADFLYRIHKKINRLSLLRCLTVLELWVNQNYRHKRHKKFGNERWEFFTKIRQMQKNENTIG